MDGAPYMTRHAVHRAQQRGLPQHIVDVIIDYGTPMACRDGGSSFILSRSAMSEIRKDFGRHFAASIESFRDAYVVLASGKVITVAFARKPFKKGGMK